MANAKSWSRNFNTMQAVAKQVKQLDGQLIVSASGAISATTGLGFSGSLSGSTYKVTIGAEGQFGNSRGFDPQVVPSILSAVGTWQGATPAAITIAKIQAGLTATGSFVEFKATPITSGSALGSGSIHFSINVKNSTV